MTERKLSARARRIIVAGEALYGARWQSAMARSIDVSKQLISFIANGDRPVTDDVEDKVAHALLREADRLRATVQKLDEIAWKILHARPLS